MYSLRRTAGPAVEPLSLDQVRTHCRLDPDDSSEDSVLTIYLRAAREYVEEQTGRALIEQTWVLTRDGFPGSWFGALSGGPVPSTFSVLETAAARGSAYPASLVPALMLPRGRVLSIVSVQYYDSTNALQTLAPETYVADTNSEPGRVQPVFGSWWPITAFRSGAVQVTYTAGYGSAAADLPAALTLAILLLVGHFYENREATQAALTGNGPMPLPLGVDSLLAPYTDSCLSYES